MAQRFSFGGVKLSTGANDSPAIPDEDTPFRLAVLGDFSGRCTRFRTKTSIAGRRAVVVDRDSFDEVLAKSGVQLGLPIGGSTPLTLRFFELDDFQ